MPVGVQARVGRRRPGRRHRLPHRPPATSATGATAPASPSRCGGPGARSDEAEAVLGDGLIRLRLGAAAAERPATIYLPEGMQPLVRSLTAVKGEIAPAPPLPPWLAYGDWTTQGWIASGPAQGWAAIAARKSGLNLVNLGYAGRGRGEIASAEQIAALDAEVITIAYGESCWTRVPHSTAMIEAGLDAFLDVVRQGHPETPIIVMSPVLRPDCRGRAQPARRHPRRHPPRHRVGHSPARRGRVTATSPSFPVATSSTRVI